MHRFHTWNGPMPTTAAQVGVTTGTVIKTMLQIATPATRQMQIISWGITLSAATVGTIELLQTDVAATVTAHVAAGVQPIDPNAPASLMTLGTTGTGYTASAEGTITATRVFDVLQLNATTPGNPMLEYHYQFMPDARPIIAISKFLRVRVTCTPAVTMTCDVTWDE